MTGWSAKKFWSEVSVTADGDGYSVRLDDKAVRTPLKAPLLLPTERFADAIAQEWRAVEETVDPNAMPFTRAANSAIDKIKAQRREVIEMLAAYGDSDLLCYRAEQPQELVDRQEAAWTPWLNWAAEIYGARLQVTKGILPVSQSDDALEKLRAPLDALSDFQLTGAHDLITISGSLVLALAVVDGALGADDAWRIARLDEAWQIEQWGKDDEAEAFAESKRQDFLRALDLVRLSRAS